MVTAIVTRRRRVALNLAAVIAIAMAMEIIMLAAAMSLDQHPALWSFATISRSSRAPLASSSHRSGESTSSTT
jgi:hypothetical protein